MGIENEDVSPEDANPVSEIPVPDPANSPLEMLTIERATDDELRKFVDDFVSSRIFTDRHIRPSDVVGTMSMIFMPIALGAFSKYEKESLKIVGCIYEYMSEAGPRSVNGYPIFFSMRFLHVEDWKRACKAIEREQERRGSIKLDP